MDACKNCRFVHVIWRAGDSYEYQQDYMPYETIRSTRTSDRAQCRRHAPRVAQTQYQCDGWPSISLTDWCGEHAPMSDKGP